MSSSSTPMMSQWQACKEKARDALLLFRLGDFYEAFHEDAKVVSQVLGVVLTQRQGIPMCGVPAHVVESSIDKLIVQGFKVALAEQMEDPSLAKGLVRRDISRIITPGTVVNSDLIQENKNNYIAAIIPFACMFGVAFLDVTTGEFHAIEVEGEQKLLDELHRMRPAEFLITNKFKNAYPEFFVQLSLSFSFLVNEREEERFSHQRSLQILLDHFHLHSLERLGNPVQTTAWAAAGALLIYVKEELGLSLPHVQQIGNASLKQTLSLDRATARNLDLPALFDLLNRTATAMGARLLRRWLEQPLCSISEIQGRQEILSLLLSSYERMKDLHQVLRGVRDLERLIAKISSRCASPRDLLSLGHSLMQIPAIQAILQLGALERLLPSFSLGALAYEITNSLKEQLPLRVSDGGLFKEGVHPELDRLRSLKNETVDWIARYQARLREETGIKTLKVGYTRAFGYYIEVSRGKGEQVPVHFQRRQTLVNGERFITEELKTRESEVLLAEERLQALEEEAFEQLRSKCAAHLDHILGLAKQIARLDALLALSFVAKEMNFVRPIVDEGDQIVIRKGRHPIVENVIGSSRFIPNDVELSSSQQLLLLTGPNMGGKSTFIRQVAIIVILAQMGSYVPAEHAQIGLVDKLFSRIGASDDLARGQSTFMVEMSETANILQNMTSRSLVLLDEIGRGTSTYDGIAIAWAVAEFLLNAEGKQAKTLFATHYWELTRLEKECSHAFNMHVAIEETEGNILFLHKILPGAATRSYGIHVAKLAGLPQRVIHRAEQLLKGLEEQKAKQEKLDKKKESLEQFTFL